MATHQEAIPNFAKLKAESEKLEKVNTERRQLIQHLFNLNEQSEIVVAQLQNEVEQLRKHEKYDRAEIKQLKQAKEDLENRLDAAPFVVVLVDGDITLFLDDFIRAGLRGGHDAAHSLHDHLKEYFKSVCGFKHHWKIVVRIFANFNGLAKAYCDAGIVPDPRVVRDFLVSFNRELPFFEFIDAGSDKEATDKKIQDNFELYHCVEQCKHVLLASSGDTSYVTFLRRYSARTKALSLLKSLPFPQEFKILAQNFTVKEFKNIFKAEKLKPRALELPSETTDQKVSVWASPSSLQATAISRPIASASSSTSTQARASPNPPGKHEIWLNHYAERLDPPLKWDPVRVKELIPEKLCLKFFLATCENTKYSCWHEHEYQGTTTLDISDKQALYRMARSIPCFSGLYCRESSCIYGHECIYGDFCKHGSSCKFGAEMHNVSKEGKHVV